MDEMRKFVFEGCNYNWELPHGTSRPNECQDCKSENVHRHHGDRGRGYGHRKHGGMNLMIA